MHTFCSYCQKPIDKDAIKCNSCGSYNDSAINSKVDELTSGNNQNEDMYNSNTLLKKKNDTFIYFLIGVIFLIILTFIFTSQSNFLSDEQTINQNQNIPNLSLELEYLEIEREKLKLLKSEIEEYKRQGDLIEAENKRRSLERATNELRRLSCNLGNSWDC